MPNILNQDEIDSLLGAMERGEIDKAENKGSLSNNVHDYNFRRPNLITKDQLRNFETVHETFSREMISTLALFLRTNVELSLVSTEQQQYSEFISSLSSTSHCVVFSAEPLPGLAIIEVNLSLFFGLIDMMLGGKGDVETEIRTPTDIEVSVMDPVMDRILDKLKGCWSALMEVKIKKERTESNPEYIQAAPPDAPVVVLAFDAKIGLANGIINICYPLPMIQAVNEHLAASAGQMDSYYGRRADEQTRKQVIQALLEVPLPLAVELGSARIRGRDLMSLSPGDVLVLDKELSELMSVTISSRALFSARPGRIKDRLYVRIQERISHDKGSPSNISVH
ncbi:MAG: flagellar motor switch protein FliM [Lentisphaerae bacterium GWF2_52_8]|nr:MAG: flagellar motor switch protein FliM [Lentisphaerae bacterium GWF2_52_8]